MGRPWLDLSEVIEDAWLEDQFDVIRRLQTINGFGEPVESIFQTFSAVGGVVYPTGDNTLTRTEAFESQMDSIEIITRFAIRTAGVDTNGRNFLPDIITWDGKTYIPRQVNSYSRIGAGFWQVQCVGFEWNAPVDGPTDDVDALLLIQGGPLLLIQGGALLLEHNPISGGSLELIQGGSLLLVQGGPLLLEDNPINGPLELIQGGPLSLIEGGNLLLEG